MAKLSEWKPYERFVQGGLVDGQFLSAAFTLIAAGPPRLANVGGAAGAAGTLSGGDGDGKKDWALPVGVVQNVGLSHNRNFARFWELGSERSYFISGRTTGQLQLSRIMYHGPSLLRMLYAYYQDLIPPTTVPFVFANPGAATVANPHDVKIPPGYENIFLNLASDLFSQPIGMLMYFRDSNEDTVGAIYLESCYIPSHQIATDAGGTVIQESAAIQFERAVPVAVKGLALVNPDFNPATGF
jgi:hypothetical protein